MEQTNFSFSEKQTIVHVYIIPVFYEISATSATFFALKPYEVHSLALTRDSFFDYRRTILGFQVFLFAIVLVSVKPSLNAQTKITKVTHNG